MVKFYLVQLNMKIMGYERILCTVICFCASEWVWEANSIAIAKEMHAEGIKRGPQSIRCHVHDEKPLGTVENKNSGF